MADSLTTLVKVLARKERSMELLLGILEEEQACLIGFDTPSLDLAGIRKQEVMSEMEAVNLECRSALDAAGEAQGLPANGNLSALISRLPMPLKRELELTQERLFALGGRIDEALELNRGLVESAVGHVNRSMTLFHKLFSVAPVYGQRGMMMNRPTEARIIRAEI